MGDLHVRAREHDHEHLRDGREVSPWLERFAEVLGPGLRALELGCGLGHDAAELIGRGLTLVALDRSRERLAGARRRAPEAHLLVADLTVPLPFPSGRFDLVVASLSLHYFTAATTHGIVAEIARVLREDGRLLCRVNATGDVVHGYGVGPEREPDLFEVRPGHTKRFFTEETLRDTLDPAFDVRRIAPRLTVTAEGEKQTLECLAVRRGPRR